MVRRIVYDSDFEEEENQISPNVCGEKGGLVDEIAVSSAEEVISRLNSPESIITAPRSVRKLVRQRDLETKKNSGTYDYDSDIYTEESSLGSFIEDSDDDDNVQQSENENSGSNLRLRTDQ